MSNSCVVDAGTRHDKRANKPTDKRQYTLKGVEAEAIELMRSAANKDGMKIGAWVSHRLKEAAQNSLKIDKPETDGSSKRESLRKSAGQSRFVQMNDTDVLIAGLVEKIEKLEEEIAEQGRTQRVILTRLISNLACDFPE